MATKDLKEFLKENKDTYILSYLNNGLSYGKELAYAVLRNYNKTYVVHMPLTSCFYEHDNVLQHVLHKGVNLSKGNIHLFSDYIDEKGKLIKVRKVLGVNDFKLVYHDIGKRDVEELSEYSKMITGFINKINDNFRDGISMLLTLGNIRYSASISNKLNDFQKLEITPILPNVRGYLLNLIENTGFTVSLDKIKG